MQVFIDDIDGVGATHGPLGSARVDASDGETVPGEGDDDTSRRCFHYTFNFPAHRVEPGVYDLVVVITLASKPCDDHPGKPVSDLLGYAVIPVLVWLLGCVTAWAYRAGWRRLAMLVGAVASCGLALSVVHVSEAVAAWTGATLMLATMLAVVIDCGLVASEAVAILVSSVE